MNNVPSPSPKPTRFRLGDVLRQKNLISAEQLEQALARQKQTGQRLGQVLVDSGALTYDRLAAALAEQLHLPLVNLKAYPFKPELVRLLPQGTARRLQAVVLEERPHDLLVAVADPFNLQIYDELVRLLGRDVALAVAPIDQLDTALDRVFRRTEEITDLARTLEKEIGQSFSFGALGAEGPSDEAPVVRFLQTVFEDAMQVNASDIHVEPQETEILIRFRIDGVLHQQTRLDKRISAALAQRLKLMASLDISERRLPQDGRFEIQARGEPVDVRMSTLPSQYGESIVMRLLRRSATVGRLDQLGMPEGMRERIGHLLKRGSGMILVTGPTGSGKTTTLYAAMASLDSARLKIMTVEDPVEYRLAGIVQTQVNDKIDLDFARVLRAALRQDPDVILVGEIRDQETAEIALRAAITGHMVLSTLHTRDAASTPMRLLDMGAPSFMVATALNAVLAQRLVRVNCEICSEPTELTPAEREWTEAMLGHAAPTLRQRAGRGCPSCNHSGYLGRTGVYEMFEMDPELLNLAAHGQTGAFSKLAYERMQGKTLAHHALQLVAEGRTTIAEAMKVSAQTEA